MDHVFSTVMLLEPDCDDDVRWLHTVLSDAIRQNHIDMPKSKSFTKLSQRVQQLPKPGDKRKSKHMTESSSSSSSLEDLQQAMMHKRQSREGSFEALLQRYESCNGNGKRGGGTSSKGRKNEYDIPDDAFEATQAKLMQEKEKKKGKTNR